MTVVRKRNDRGLGRIGKRVEALGGLSYTVTGGKFFGSSAVRIDQSRNADGWDFQSGR